jgi:hypothetical protein
MVLEPWPFTMVGVWGARGEFWASAGKAPAAMVLAARRRDQRRGVSGIAVSFEC